MTNYIEFYLLKKNDLTIVVRPICVCGGGVLLSFEVLGSRCSCIQIVSAYSYFSKLEQLTIVAELGE